MVLGNFLRKFIPFVSSDPDRPALNYICAREGTIYASDGTILVETILSGKEVNGSRRDAFLNPHCIEHTLDFADEIKIDTSKRNCVSYRARNDNDSEQELKIVDFLPRDLVYPENILNLFPKGEPINEINISPKLLSKIATLAEGAREIKLKFYKGEEAPTVFEIEDIRGLIMPKRELIDGVSKESS